jgi:hypothetical protein
MRGTQASRVGSRDQAVNQRLPREPAASDLPSENRRRHFLQIVWVSAEGSPARSGKIARALRARQRCFAPLVFYLLTFTTLPLHALGFGPKELTHAS